ncbi:hypothetical protein SAMN05421505_11266 [Sinosporangium album]|uniref:Right handed beta helix region n=1 Tax=Sinosporangium album TaxID=504805 RepID=A0A1G8A9B2_9ACTN|nr:hypothetical protein [Sinosporangium album]SDH17518.1 hypothetical protein SAMN05421505_11266 [Sinosporangium album]
MRKTSALLGLLAAAALTLPAAPAFGAAPAKAAFLAPDTDCTSSLGAVTVPGKLVVPNGATCTLIGTVVLGGVEVRIDSTLNASGVSVAAGVLASQHRLVSITANSTVQGSIKAVKGGGVTVTDSSAFGGLEITENTARPGLTRAVSDNGGILVAKNQGGATVHSSRANANLMVEENYGGTTSVHSNVAGDNLSVNKNLGGTDIVNNSSNDNINCSDNVPAPTGSGNVGGADGAGSKTGQCAAL